MRSPGWLARRVCSVQEEKGALSNPHLSLEGSWSLSWLAWGTRFAPDKRRWALVPKRVNIFFFHFSFR